MITLTRTNSNNRDFIFLTKQLNEFLSVIDGDQYSFLQQFNNIDDIQQVVIIYENNTPLSCGAVKQFNSTSMEIKRMFTNKNARKKRFCQYGFKRVRKLDTRVRF